MISRKLYQMTAGRPCRLIKPHGRPYLERYYLGQRWGWTAYLHRFVGADGDQGAHDHPWRRAFALCLAGGYQEERLQAFCTRSGWVDVLRQVKAGRVNVLDGRDFHRIVQARPETWTLFLHGPTWKGWGFLHKVEPDHAGRHTVVYHQPFELTDGRPWWENAPTGAEAGREPFTGDNHGRV